MSVVTAINDGDVERVKKLIEVEGHKMSARASTDGTSYLMLAVQKQKPDIVSYLLSSKCVVDAINEKGYTALMLAVQNNKDRDLNEQEIKKISEMIGQKIPTTEISLLITSYLTNSSIVGLLLQAGASLTQQEKCGRGYNAIQLACDSDNAFACESLLKKNASPGRIKAASMHPLVIAAEKGYTPICEILVKYGVKLAKASENDASYNFHDHVRKHNALDYACANGHLQTCKYLLTQAPSDEYKHRALHHACFYEKKDVMLYLLEQKADVNYIYDHNSVLHDALVGLTYSHEAGPLKLITKESDLLKKETGVIAHLISIDETISEKVKNILLPKPKKVVYPPQSLTWVCKCRGNKITRTNFLLAQLYCASCGRRFPGLTPLHFTRNELTTEWQYEIQRAINDKKYESTLRYLTNAQACEILDVAQEFLSDDAKAIGNILLKFDLSASLLTSPAPTPSQAYAKMLRVKRQIQAQIPVAPWKWHSVFADINPVARILILGTSARESPLRHLRAQPKILQQIFSLLKGFWQNNAHYTQDAYHLVSEYVSFPEKQNFDIPNGKKLININMMPFVMGEITSLPEEVRDYCRIIEACPIAENEKGKIGYLTINEGITEKGQTHRRGGLHIDAPGTLLKESGQKRHYKTTETMYYSFGGGASTYEMDRVGFSGGIYMASTVGGTCEVYPTKISNPADVVGAYGDCEHLREVLPCPVALGHCKLVWLTDTTPHESLPFERTQFRQFFRLVTNRVSAWHSRHCTPNPLGIKPDTEIIDDDKFSHMAPTPLPSSAH